jgi:hypothetical protein
VADCGYIDQVSKDLPFELLTLALALVAPVSIINMLLPAVMALAGSGNMTSEFQMERV